MWCRAIASPSSTYLKPIDSVLLNKEYKATMYHTMSCDFKVSVQHTCVLHVHTSPDAF